MKKFFFSFLFVIAGASMAYSQDTFGIKAGLNLASQFIRIDNQSAKTKIAPTFHVSAYYDARISPGFSIQPGISLEGKGGRSEIDGQKLTDRFLYLQVPVNFLGRVPVGTGDFFFGGGPYAAYGVDARVTSGREAIHLQWGDGMEQLNPWDAGLTAVFGYRHIKGFVFSISSSAGFINISNSNEAKYLNRVSSIGVAYEFGVR